MLSHRATTHNLSMLLHITTSPNPRILLVSGIHGDECEVIDFVKEAVQHYSAALPPLLYIPELSPSAVRQKTRLNSEGKDINRCFFSDTDVFEVLEAQKVLLPHYFQLAVSFHEDPSQDQFYLYDTGVSHEIPSVQHFLNYLCEIGVSLWSGIDDDNDPFLGYEVVNGRASVPPGRLSRERNKGIFEIWLINTLIAEHVLTLEIPGKAPLKIKRAIVDAFFRLVISNA